MILKIYTVRDSKAGSYLQPFCAQNVGVAVRMVTATARDPESMFNQFPGDYDLYEVGEFDQQIGRVSESKPEYIGKVVDFIVVKQEEIPGVNNEE